MSAPGRMNNMREHLWPSVARGEDDEAAAQVGRDEKANSSIKAPAAAVLVSAKLEPSHQPQTHLQRLKTNTNTQLISNTANMQFKLATVVAVASALLSPAQASVAARQNDPCPQSGVSCGWFLLNSASNSPCTFGTYLSPLSRLPEQFVQTHTRDTSSDTSLTRTCE